MEYGVSGVTTFLINQDGRLYQKAMGKDSSQTSPEHADLRPGFFLENRDRERRISVRHGGGVGRSPATQRETTWTDRSTLSRPEDRDMNDLSVRALEAADTTLLAS